MFTLTYTLLDQNYEKYPIVRLYATFKYIWLSIHGLGDILHGHIRSETVLFLMSGHFNDSKCNHSTIITIQSFDEKSIL